MSINLKLANKLFNTTSEATNAACRNLLTVVIYEENGKNGDRITRSENCAFALEIYPRNSESLKGNDGYFR